MVIEDDKDFPSPRGKDQRSFRHMRPTETSFPPLMSVLDVTKHKEGGRRRKTNGRGEGEIDGAGKDAPFRSRSLCLPNDSLAHHPLDSSPGEVRWLFLLGRRGGLRVHEI